MKKKVYLDAGVAVEYVGHPLIKEAKASIDKSQFKNSAGLNSNKKLIGLFPGSRVSEIENNYPIILSAAKNLLQLRQDIQFITPVATTLPDNLIQKHICEANIEVVTTLDNIYEVINACDAIAAASGTVTLRITQ